MNDVMKQMAENQMKQLIRELIKAIYVQNMLGSSLFKFGIQQNKMKQLRKLEEIYPEMTRSFSPTQYSGFDEYKAIQAYGGIENWNKVKGMINLIYALGEE